MKISDKMLNWEKENPDKVFFSLEFFPPKTETGVLNLYDRFDRFAVLNPMWIDVTWGAGGSTSNKTIEICANAIKYHGLDPLMHLTCTNMPQQMIDTTLQECKQAGIVNILALRGDAPTDQEEWTAVEGGFQYAADLVKHIRKIYGDFFCIAVAGYPEGHLENPDKQDDLRRLKEKVDAGADFIITQLFYDTTEFFHFVDSARAIGIKCPIIPGIMPIQSFNGFKKMTAFCKTKVPDSVNNGLEVVKGDDQQVKDFGVQHGVEMCVDLLKHGVQGLHFYTLNLEVTITRILESLHLVDIHVSNKELPWRPLKGRRAEETVRPIFWSNRPKSYIHRTSAWDDFPNGRWGNRDSPAYGDPFLSVCHDPDERSRAHRREMWGDELNGIEDIKYVFCAYLKSSPSTPRLPWCSDSLGDETSMIRKQLLKMNLCGLLTINSQPRVNGALSADPYFGWGPKNGFVYQKAYAEFFCSPQTWAGLLPQIQADEELTFSAINSKGDQTTNCAATVNAVTWGVFPGEEIKQPTIVDQESFAVWKDEAFSLWIDEWAPIYPKESASAHLIQQIHDTWYLANVVDNNFVCGDLFGKLVKFLRECSRKAGTEWDCLSPKSYANGWLPCSTATTASQTKDSQQPQPQQPQQQQ
eukprot:GHVS01082627.1.p1 GENE.GHVS01082627.1~~GHVS01082627.1.p1  ORF type:complete len:639 (-),score=90.35 GHVS01082627.1:426-2342(-)